MQGSLLKIKANDSWSVNQYPPKQNRRLENIFYKHWDWNVKDKMDNRKYDNCKCHTMHFVDPFTRSGETDNYERNCSMINLHTWVRRGVKQAVQTWFRFYCGCTDASWFRNHGRKIFWLLLFRVFPSTALFLQIRLYGNAVVVAADGRRPHENF